MRKTVFYYLISLAMTLIFGFASAQNSDQQAAFAKDQSAVVMQNGPEIVYNTKEAGDIIIGDGTLTSERYPVYAYFGYSYTQSIYLQSELGGSPVFITTIRYYFAGTSLANSNDWTIYLGHTSKSEFTGAADWVPTNEMTQVYSGTFTNPGAPGWIEFDITDFEYNGVDNLVIAVDENAAGYDESADRFYCTGSLGTVRSLVYYSDDTNPDPTAPLDASYYDQQVIPNIILGTMPVSGANVTFTVTDGAIPLENVGIEIGTNTFYTDNLGVVVRYLPVGTTDWTASLFGYSDETGSVTVVDGVDDNINITMTALTTYTVTVNVDDILANNLENVAVTAQFGGLTVFDDLTDVNGQVSFDLPAGDYTLDLVANGYNSLLSQAFSVVDVALNLDYVLTEIIEDPQYPMVDVMDHDAHFSWNEMEEVKLSQHSGVGADGGYYQDFAKGYGVVYDLTAYPDAIISSVDFHHVSWDLSGTWEYKFHVANMSTSTEAYVTPSLYTTGDDQWEYNVALGDVTDLGGNLVGIFLEPFGNVADDAYPDLNTDADQTLDGASYYAVDLTTFVGTAADAGDFVMDLWIITANGAKIKAPKRVVANHNSSAQQGTPKNANVVNSKPADLFVAQSTPVKGQVAEVSSKSSAKAFESYTVYLNGVEIANSVTDTFWDWTGLASGDYTAGVEAVYTTGTSNLVTVDFTIEAAAFITFVVSDDNSIPALVENAIVTVEGNDYVTDVNGETEPIWLLAGDHNYTVTKFGYETVNDIVTVVDAVNTTEPVTLPILSSYDVTFTVENILSSLLENATVTVNFGGEEIVSGLTDASGNYTANLPIGSYTYDVELAGYESVFGIALEVVDAVVAVPVTLIEDMATATGLTYVISENTVTLNWFEPNHSFITPAWIHWDDGTNNDGIGTGGAADFSVAVKFEPADIAEYDGGVITKFKFFPNEAAATYTINIWQGANAANLIYSEPISTFTNATWNEITLATPVEFDASQELWIGYAISTTAGYPAGCDATLENPGKGNMIYWEGVWQQLTVLSATLTYDWNIQAYIDAPIEGKAFLNTYNVYLNGALQTGTPIVETTYDFVDLVDASYTGGVTAVYTTGESDVVEVTWIITSVENEEVKLAVYPNPSSGLFRVNTAKEYNYNVCDMTGKVVFSSELNANDNVIDLSEYSKGMYIINIFNDVETYNFNVVVK